MTASERWDLNAVLIRFINLCTAYFCSIQSSSVGAATKWTVVLRSVLCKCFVQRSQTICSRKRNLEIRSSASLRVCPTCRWRTSWLRTNTGGAGWGQSESLTVRRNADHDLAFWSSSVRPMFCCIFLQTAYNIEHCLSRLLLISPLWADFLDFYLIRKSRLFTAMEMLVTSVHAR